LLILENKKKTNDLEKYYYGDKVDKKEKHKNKNLTNNEEEKTSHLEVEKLDTKINKNNISKISESEEDKEDQVADNVDYENEKLLEEENKPDFGVSEDDEDTDEEFEEFLKGII